MICATFFKPIFHPTGLIGTQVEMTDSLFTARTKTHRRFSLQILPSAIDQSERVVSRQFHIL